MKSKIFLFLLILPIIGYSQKLDRFIIGADWFNSRDDQTAPLGTEYWKLGREFGLNFVTLNLDMNEAQIKSELLKAYNNNANKIDVELHSFVLFDKYGYGSNDEVMDTLTRRWLYQIEGSVEESKDFNYLAANFNVNPDRDQRAETHWSQKDRSLQVQKNNYVHLTPGCAPFVLVKDLKESLWAEIPDGTDLYVKIRLRTRNVTGRPEALRCTLSFDNHSPAIQEEVVVSSSNNDVWTEIPVFTSYRKPRPIPSSIPDSSQTLPGEPELIRNEYGGIMGIPEYSYSSNITRSPMNIVIEYMGQVDCDVDYIAFDDYGANNLFTGAFDSVMIKEVNKYSEEKSLKFLKIKDEVDRNMAYPIAYVKGIIDEEFKKRGKSDKNGTSIHIFDLTGSAGDFLPQEYLGKTDMSYYKMDAYPISEYGTVLPNDPNANDYTNWVQNAFNNFFVNKLELAASAINRFKSPFIFEPQAHGWHTIGAPGNVREPSPFEIKAMCNLAIAFGAKGIHYFMYTRPTIFTNTTVYPLLDSSNVNNPTPRYKDVYGYDKWETLKSYNQKLKSIGDELLKLNWAN